MKLKYNDNTINVTITTNQKVMRYHFQKLYYAIIIKNCNHYSSIANKQKLDVVMTNDNLEILAYKKEMHENTFLYNKNCTTTILLPPKTFKDITIGQKFVLE